LNGYLPPLADAERAADYLRAPGLGADSGIVGAILLATQAHRELGAAVQTVA
jgi:hypothetical protein